MLVALQAVASESVTVSQVQSLDRFQAEQERLRKLIEGKPKAYQDNVMDPATVPTQADISDAPPDESQTGFRAYSVESRLGLAQSNNDGLSLKSASELGVRAQYRHETFNFGEYVLQADWRTHAGEGAAGFGSQGVTERRQSSRGTLRNLGFPITPGTFADTAAGDISAEIVDAFSRSYRLSLGNATVRGVGTRVFDRNFDLRLGVGERGSLTGGPFPGFQRSEGTLAWAGYSQRLESGRFVGLQASRATGVPITTESGVDATLPGREAISSMAAVAGFGLAMARDGDLRARLTVLHSQRTATVTNANRSATGIFLEGGVRTGRYRHELGLFSAQPGLFYGDHAISADNRGVYWRVDHNGTRLNWGASMEHEQQNPARDPVRLSATRTGASGSLHYRMSGDISFGGQFQVARSSFQSAQMQVGQSGGSRSLSASAWYQVRIPGWGRSRFNLAAYRNELLVSNGVAGTGDEFQWEHDWMTGRYETMVPEFVTTLGVANDRSETDRQVYPTAGLVARYWPDADWHVAGSLRYTSRRGNLFASRGLSGSLDTERILAPGWRLGASVNLNQAVVTTAAVSTGSPGISRSDEKSASLYLRWDGSRGTPYQAIGLQASGAAGGGEISGEVYFDTNRDGERQAGEAGVPGVEVFLDSRYRVTTDRDGRFDFSLVTTGRHQLTLRPESVPLPWGTALESGLSLEVPLRGQATARMPVVRVGN